MLSYLQKFLKEMVPQRGTKKETMSEVYKNNEKDIIYSLFSRRGSRGTTRRKKTKQMNKK